MKKLFNLVARIFTGTLVMLVAVLPISAFACNTNSADFGTAGGTIGLSHTNAITGLDGTSNFTYSMWVKVNSQPSNATQFLFESRNPSATGFQLEAYYVDTGGVKSIQVDRIGGSNGSAVLAATTLSSVAWTNIIMKYDGANIVLSLNARASSNSAAASGSLNFGGAQQFSILNNGTPGGTAGKMIVDDVRVYNTYLNDATTDAIYNTPGEISCATANLVAYYTFDVNVTTDCTSNNNTLTNTGSIPQSSDVAFNDCVASAIIRSDDEWWAWFMSFF